MDHDALLEALVSGTRGWAEVSVTPCLLACELSNVVVVSPGPFWFREVLTLETVAELVAWLRAGGPAAPLPDSLAQHRVVEPRALASMTAAAYAADRDANE